MAMLEQSEKCLEKKFNFVCSRNCKVFFAISFFFRCWKVENKSLLGLFLKIQIKWLQIRKIIPLMNYFAEAKPVDDIKNIDFIE